MITIMFDGSCAGWSKWRELNQAFLRQQKAFLTAKLQHRGYVYLNEVYESLGAKWNPKDENICWHGRPIWFEFEPVGECDFMVKIS